MQALETALDLLKQLDALRPLTADQEQRIWQKFRLDWNYHSNNLEGNSLTYGETKSLLLHNITAQGKPLKDHLEITGHNEALLEINDAVKKQQPLTEAFLRQLHTLILKERYQVNAQTADGQPTKKWVEVGQYKTQPNHVLTVTGETFRFAEPFEVSAKMQALIAEANERKATPAEGLLLAAKLHYEFVLIHPFDDGNGRMARLLMNLVLMQYGFPPAIIKTEFKEAYFAALRQADGNQFEVFAEYIAARIKESLQVMLSAATGGEIEESDDLDKKIKLFIGLAKEKRGELPVLMSKDVLHKFIDSFALILGQKLQIGANQFATIYRSIDMRFSINREVWVTFDEVKFFGAAISQTDVKSFAFSIFYNDLSISPNHPRYETDIFVSVGQYQFEVFLNENAFALEQYNTSRIDELIELLTRTAKQAHLDWLQANSEVKLPD